MKDLILHLGLWSKLHKHSATIQNISSVIITQTQLMTRAEPNKQIFLIKVCKVQF